MSKIKFEDLLGTGAHFGHVTRKWNPNYTPFVLMEKNGIHIINLYKNELVEALNNSTVIANSIYIAQVIKELYGVDSKVEYPIIDIDRLKLEFDSLPEAQDVGISFIGDSEVKGLGLAKVIAQSLPEEKFCFYSRYHSKRIIEGNIIYLPWEINPAMIYKRAKLVIVPSQWREAYGRVARESYLLGIPVLVSNIGGLPESVDYNEDNIINNYTEVNEWISQIKYYLG